MICHMSVVLPVAAVSIMLSAIFCGLVSPAVWSRKPARRRAAMEVLGVVDCDGPMVIKLDVQFAEVCGTKVQDLLPHGT